MTRLTSMVSCLIISPNKFLIKREKLLDFKELMNDLGLNDSELNNSANSRLQVTPDYSNKISYKKVIYKKSL